MNDFPLIHAIQANDWTYVGEGNQNLVVRYTGSLNAFSGRVLRVVKRHSQSKHKVLILSQQKEFTDKIIQPLLGEEYITTMQPISTSGPFLIQLATLIQPARPLQRRLETDIMTDAPIAFMMADLAHMWPGSPTVTFELKPKWGFKPSSDAVVNKMKSLYCRYCMHSHLRRPTREKDSYCPLDLYSETPSLLHKAIHVLLNKTPLEKTLKVYINGEYTSLTKRDPDAEYKSLFLNTRLPEPLLSDILGAILLHDPILLKLKTLQADLDPLDVENILPLYYQQLNAIETDVDSFAKVVGNYKKRKLDTNTPITDVQRVLEYVLSMTFKDCSIMINATPAKEHHSPDDKRVVALNNGLVFHYDVKVIDTDLKRLDKIPYWHELDRSIVTHAIETGFSKESAC